MMTNPCPQPRNLVTPSMLRIRIMLVDRNHQKFDPRLSGHVNYALFTMQRLHLTPYQTLNYILNSHIYTLVPALKPWAVAAYLSIIKA